MKDSARILFLIAALTLTACSEPNPNEVVQLKIARVNLTGMEDGKEVRRDMEPLYVHSALLASGEVVIVTRETLENVQIGDILEAVDVGDPIHKVNLDSLYGYTDDQVFIETAKQHVRDVANDLVAGTISFDEPLE